MGRKDSVSAPIVKHPVRVRFRDQADLIHPSSFILYLGDSCPDSFSRPNGGIC